MFMAVAAVFLSTAVVFVREVLSDSPLGLPTRAEALGLAAAYTAFLLTALRRPMAGWLLSLVVTGVTAWMLVNGAGLSGVSFPWPWTGLAAEAGVLFLVGMGVRPRAAVVSWVATVALGAGLTAYAHEVQADRVAAVRRVLAAQGAEPNIPLDPIHGNWPLLAVLSGAAVIAGTALRGSGEAARRLTAQEAATSSERSHRVLLQERSRIARELHDVVAHHMTVIAVHAEAAPYRTEHLPQETTETLAVIRRNAVEGLAELRRILGLLRSDAADGVPRRPQPALADLAELLHNVRKAGLDVDVAITGTPAPLPPGAELAAYRIVQEALSNVLRHAPGSTAHVEIVHARVGIALTIRNSPPPAGPVASDDRPGHGLTGMRERVAVLNGTLRAGPTPDGGYEVAAHIPTDGPSVGLP